ncbi:Gfo/Idh/MocA family protein [Microbacterium hydrocarbonoxydans]|uniref:Gfo/Idh/MocA family protein n=1 Tax=Microbacterium hydrocarbonoxydans TaxID=273678 RepID=UPI0013D90625|nr:Gfo/Idh/MocA family oxidoreductase [Microbacterium hydrocarbonoxydans]
MTGIVIVGVAHSHVEYALAELRERPDLRLDGVHDPDQEAAAGIAAEFGAPVLSSLDEVLRLRSSIVVCAGVYSERADIVLAALRGGADVLCDKPLCLDLDELAAIEATAASTGRRVALMLEKRTYPETLALTEAIEEGRLGVPVALASWAPHKLLREQRAPWFLDPDNYGGILADLLVHDVDIALQITGATRGTVRGWLGPTIETGFHLQGGATVVLDDGDGDGVRLSAEVDWLTPSGSDIHGDYRLRVVGAEGTAEVYWGRGVFELTTASEPRHSPRAPRGRRPAQDALDALLAGGADADRATRDAIVATRIALLAERSARMGGVELNWEA